MLLILAINLAIICLVLGMFRRSQCFISCFLSLTTVWAWCAASISSPVSLLAQLDSLCGLGGLHTTISSHSSGEPFLLLCFMVQSDTNCCRGHATIIQCKGVHTLHKYVCIYNHSDSVNNCRCHTSLAAGLVDQPLGGQWTIK